VLVVDNDDDVLRAMRALLEGWGCDVLAAADADTALALAAAAPPDMLLLDYHLDGGETGLALRERLSAAMPERPCVVITADHSGQVRAEVLGAGCQLLYKPLKPLALKSVMARFASARAAPAVGVVED
jgi:CheY-like chemotaxis protein